MIVQFDSQLAHIGTATSGRYPKGSGKNPFQHMKERRAAKKEAKRLAAIEKKRKAFESKRAKFLAGRDPEFLDPAYVFAHREFFTNKEIADIAQRVENLNKIRLRSNEWAKAAKNGKSFISKVNKAIDTAEKVETTLDRVDKITRNPAFKKIMDNLGFDFNVKSEQKKESEEKKESEQKKELDKTGDK